MLSAIEVQCSIIFKYSWIIVEELLKHYWSFIKSLLKNYWSIVEVLLEHYWSSVETLLKYYYWCIIEGFRRKKGTHFGVLVCILKPDLELSYTCVNSSYFSWLSFLYFLSEHTSSTCSNTSIYFILHWPKKDGLFTSRVFQDRRVSLVPRSDSIWPLLHFTRHLQLLNVGINRGKGFRMNVTGKPWLPVIENACMLCSSKTLVHCTNGVRLGILGGFEWIPSFIISGLTFSLVFWGVLDVLGVG